MANLSEFWKVIDQQITALRKAKSADDVLRILDTSGNPYGDSQIGNAPAFFAGSGGDQTVMEALTDAGWFVSWSEASYFYRMTAPDGSLIEYIEGDIYKIPDCT